MVGYKNECVSFIWKVSAFTQSSFTGAFSASAFEAALSIAERPELELVVGSRVTKNKLHFALVA